MVSCRERLKSQTDCDLCGRVSTTHMYTANHKQPHTQTSRPFLSGPEERLATVDGFQKAAGLSPSEFAFVLVSLFQPLSSEHTAVDVSQSLQIDFVVNMLWNHVIISYFLFFNSMKKLLWFRHSGMISPTKIVYVRNKGKLNLITENNVFFFQNTTFGFFCTQHGEIFSGHKTECSWASGTWTSSETCSGRQKHESVSTGASNDHMFSPRLYLSLLSLFWFICFLAGVNERK